MNMKWRILKTKTYEIISGTFFYVSSPPPQCCAVHVGSPPILLFQTLHNLYTLKTLKSHIKTLNIYPYMFRYLMKPFSGSS
jgi:hypothetical protein